MNEGNVQLYDHTVFIQLQSGQQAQASQLVSAPTCKSHVVSSKISAYNCFFFNRPQIRAHSAVTLLVVSAMLELKTRDPARTSRNHSVPPPASVKLPGTPTAMTNPTEQPQVLSKPGNSVKVPALLQPKDLLLLPVALTLLKALRLQELTLTVPSAQRTQHPELKVAKWPEVVSTPPNLPVPMEPEADGDDKRQRRNPFISFSSYFPIIRVILLYLTLVSALAIASKFTFSPSSVQKLLNKASNLG